MLNAVIAGYSRSPFTISFKGDLKSIRPEDLLSQVIKDLISNSNLNKDDSISLNEMTRSNLNESK